MRLWRRLRWMLALALLPFAVLGLLSLATGVCWLVRTDPRYFSPAYVQRYQDANAAVRSLEQALRTGDSQLLAELEGLRWPVRLPVSSDIALVMLWSRNDHYTTYLYFDRQSYQRYLYCFELVNGRWVVRPPGLYLAMHSGAWRQAFLPAAIAWWLMCVLGLGLVWLCRRSARVRAWLLRS